MQGGCSNIYEKIQKPNQNNFDVSSLKFSFDFGEIENSKDKQATTSTKILNQVWKKVRIRERERGREREVGD